MVFCFLFGNMDFHEAVKNDFSISLTVYVNLNCKNGVEPRIAQNWRGKAILVSGLDPWSGFLDVGGHECPCLGTFYTHHPILCKL